MTEIVLEMEFSSDERQDVVVEALTGMPGVSVAAQPWDRGRRRSISIETDDPDQVDIVREIAWQFDPDAVQHALHVAELS